MKNIVLLIFLLILTFSCSDDSTSPGDVNLRLSSSMQNSKVTNETTSSFQADDVDSLVITEARVLISAIKLHNRDKDEAEDEPVKTGPYVLQADSTGTVNVLFDTGIEEGDYDKIKFEIHKFPESERQQYIDDPVFGDFATSDRNTILIDGYYYTGGEKKYFNFVSNQTENLMLTLDEQIDINDDYVTEISLTFDAVGLFKAASILSPTEDNQKEIEKQIHRFIVALKK
ncbi:MAG: hypothetical protein ACE364_08045 [Chlorobiota bacterium]